MNKGLVYLIPSLLAEKATGTIPSSVIEAVKKCEVFFVENERSARRYLKQVLPSIVIDDHAWFTIHKAEEEMVPAFVTRLKEGKIIGIISEAGCPAVADPGQILVAAAQDLGVTIKPLVGPSSIILALMASGLNGQQFRFCGYLPVNSHERTLALKELETESRSKHCTQIFIETPYRNNQVFEAILRTCQPATRLCLAVDLSSETEWIRTFPVSAWQHHRPELHKRQAIFLLLAAAAG